MATTIALGGSPEEQTQILKLLTRYGIVNQYNEITLSQAESFDSYAKSQEILTDHFKNLAKIQEKVIEQMRDIEQEQTQFRIDDQREITKLTQCLAAKTRVIRTLRATIEERNANIDSVEEQILELEYQLSCLKENFGRGREDVGLRKVNDLEKEIRDIQNNQKALSDRILEFKQKNKQLQADGEHMKKRIELLDNRLEKISKEHHLKRKREPSEDVNERD